MEEVIPIIAIVFGTTLTGFIFYGIYKLIKMWIGGPSGDAVPREDFNRLGKAFVTFKKDAENRIKNLEAIVSDDNGGSTSQAGRQLGEPSKTIEVENDDGQKSRKQQEKSSDDGNLRNMLRE